MKETGIPMDGKIKYTLLKYKRADPAKSAEILLVPVRLEFILGNTPSQMHGRVTPHGEGAAHRLACLRR